MVVEKERKNNFKTLRFVLLFIC